MIRYFKYLIPVFIGCHSLLLAQEDPQAEIMGLLQKANSLLQSDIDSVYFYSNQAYDKAVKFQDTVLIARTVYFKALSLSERKEYDAALEVVQFSISAKKKLPPGLIGDTYNLVGSIYDQKQERDKAITYYLNAIDSYTEANSTRGLARTYLNIGVIYQDISKPQLATYFFDQSKYYSTKSGEISGIHDILDEDGGYDTRAGIEMSLKAVSEIENPEESKLAAVIYHSIGRNYWALKDYPNAIANLESSLRIKERIGFMQELDLANYLIGHSHLQMGENLLGLDFLEEAITHSSKKDIIALVLETKMEAYKNLGNYKAAMEVATSYDAFKDSIHLIQENERIAEITAQFETEKQAAEIELLESDNELQASQLTNQKNILFGTLAGIALLLTLLFFAYKNYKIKRNLQMSELTQKLLQMQLNPHFLFNALNGIQYFIKKNDVQKSTKYISSFSGLMRNILENSVEKFISIEEDHETISDFLALQQLVHNNSFDYEVTIDEALDPQNMCIPPMFTQPFVENAVIHGVSGLSEGKIEVQYKAGGNNLIVVEVADNGKGIHREKQHANSLHKSMGTSITKQRMENLMKMEKYPIELEIISKNEGQGDQGTKIVLSFPMKYI